MIRSAAILLYALLAASVVAQDNADSTRHRWHLRAQLAGYQGLLSVGGGPVLARGTWMPGLMYGFAPRAEGRDAVHQVIIRNDVVVLPQRRLSPTASLNMLLETGRHSYLSLPEPMPRGYYMAPLPQFTIGIGARLKQGPMRCGPFRAWMVQAEAVGLGSYLWYGISERGFPLYRGVGISLAGSVMW